MRIPVNAGFSCPNRDGTLGRDGCSFCDNRSFSPVVQNPFSPVDQVKDAVARNTSCKAFIPYFQPFSNTYASLEHLRSVYEPILQIDGVVGIAIGTRPDCFGPGVYDYLEELAGRTYLCVELGLQSSHDRTLIHINRGHRFSDFLKSVQELTSRNIEVAVHVILGLPGESRQEMLQTATRLSSLPILGVKVHQLMVVRGTAYEEAFYRGELAVLTLGEYADLLCEFLSRLRPDQRIHRLLANSRSELGLIAPLWCSDKCESLKTIQAYFAQRKLCQGSLFSGTSVVVRRGGGSEARSAS